MDTQDKKHDEHFDVVVIGGGASGLFAAGRAAERGKKVLVLEKNRTLGEKLLLTGGGRCNITNATYDTREFLAHLGKGTEPLFSAFAQFDVAKTFAFFERRGLSLVVEARGRAFPASQNAGDVLKVIESYAREGGAIIRVKTKVTRILEKKGRVVGVETAKSVIGADAVIVATGGLSHPETGSTGDGFTFLRDLGHSVEDPAADLVPIEVHDAWVKALSGTSLSFMKMTVYANGKKAFAKKGKVLFTHFGLSGPLVLNAARAIGTLLAQGRVTIAIDAYPDTDIGALEKDIIRVFDQAKNKMIKNVADDIMPHGMAEVFPLLFPHIPLDKKVHSITKEERRLIVDTLKALPVSVVGLMGMDRAIVSDGGVPLDEIDTKYMRSRLYPNLYVTGDMIHVNRQSGGYSLQIAWTSGYVAGSAA
ncbi:MAG: NAD(P)/FAD-dependent oxidoreductase [Candidatus Yonathbacteria bacterium]|nr:NAD(P)/FAD-dependent oxidoreductase [Candidatus Yonathbacteria bacterium]NTW47826.1 NAD(P)/FAD-dependent oxidoreductase [Candidatus Yonathbacteria bacterium]